jgi:putative ABC transport system ATP-binding protein
MSGIVLEAKGVTKVLGQGAAETQAVRDVNFVLRGGELTMLMGPSGSGKTTLLSILGCMLTPSAGTVYIRGTSTAGASAEILAKLRRDHVGFIFQYYHLFPTLTAAENIRLALELRGETGAKAKAKSHEVLARVGLTQRIKAFPSELSGGEQQRVAIARALVSHPSAILADEPTAALDSTNGQNILRLLSEIAKDSERGVLVVTHDTRLMPFADRIVNIEDGRIVGDYRGVISTTAARMSAPGRP